MGMDGEEKLFEARKTKQDAFSLKSNELLHKSSIFSIWAIKKRFELEKFLSHDIAHKQRLLDYAKQPKLLSRNCLFAQSGSRPSLDS
jgi:hypothetical protein